MELGNHLSPAHAIAHALNLIEEDRRDLDKQLDKSMDEIQRGEGISGEQVN